MSLKPKLNYEIDINEPLRSTEFVAVEGSDFDVVIRVKRCGVIQTLEGVTPKLTIANSAETWVRNFTGTAGGANDESVTIPVTGTSLDDNGTMNYDLVLTDSDANNIIHRRGQAIIYAAVPDSVTPPAGSAIDWSSYGTYVNTATDGPYTAGDGITFGTADANGKVPINADGTETQWGEITGTLASQTDLQSALNLKADDNAVVKLDPTGEQTITDSILIDYGDGNGKARLRAGNFPSLQFKDNADVFYAQLTSDEDAHTLNFDYDGAGSGSLSFRRQVGVDDIVMSFESDGTIKPRKDIVPLTTDTVSLGSALVKWLNGYISNIFTTAIQALTSAGGALKSNNGTDCLTWGAGGGTDVTSQGAFASGGADVSAGALSTTPDLSVHTLPYGNPEIKIRAGEDVSFLYLESETSDLIYLSAENQTPVGGGSPDGYERGLHVRSAGTWANQDYVPVLCSGVILKETTANNPTGFEVEGYVYRTDQDDLLMVDSGGNKLKVVTVDENNECAVRGLQSASGTIIATRLKLDLEGELGADIDAPNYRYRIGDIDGGESQVYLDIDSVYGTATLFNADLGVSGLKALTSAGGALKANGGSNCLTWGAGGGQNVSTADGLNVGGTLQVTNKQASAYTNTDKRVATMTGDETLTTTSAIVQFLDPADSDRNVDLPNGTQFTIQNTGDGAETITVRDASDVTIDTVENGVTLTFIDATGSGGWEVLT